MVDREKREGVCAKKQTCVRLTQYQAARIDELARAHRVKPSVVLRMCLEMGLARIFDDDGHEKARR